MPVMRIELTEEENKLIMKVKGDKLKIPFAKQLLLDAARKEEKRQEKAK